MMPINFDCTSVQDLNHNGFHAWPVPFFTKSKTFQLAFAASLENEEIHSPVNSMCILKIAAL